MNYAFEKGNVYNMIEKIKDVIDLLEKKDRPYVSNIIYVICGLILINIYTIKDLQISINSDFFNKVSLREELTDTSDIVQIASTLWVAYITMCIIRYIFLYLSKKLSDEEFAKHCIILHTIEDTIDLINSITSFIFVSIVALQYNKTYQFFYSKNAWFLYVFIVLKFISFILYRFYFHNSKIVNSAINSK